MPIAAAIVVVVVVVAAFASADDPPACLADALQAAYQRDEPFWSHLPPISTTAKSDHVVLLGAFIDLYMNELRVQRTLPAPLAAFVASLPVAADVQFEVYPHPDVTEPSPQRPPSPLSNLLEMFSSIVQLPPPPPPSSAAAIPSALDASRLVLNIFGPMLRAGLYGAGADPVGARQSADFVNEYVRAMAQRAAVPRLTALAVLARDLCLSAGSAEPDLDFDYACGVLKRRRKVPGLELDLSNAIDLIGGGIVGKADAADLADMTAEQVLALLVAVLARGNAPLRALCDRDADLIRRTIGAKAETIAEAVVFLMAVSDSMGDLPDLVQALRRQSADEMRLLSLLALFYERHRSLIVAVKASSVSDMEQIPVAIRDTIGVLKASSYWTSREAIPAQHVVDLIRQRLPEYQQIQGADWFDSMAILPNDPQ